MADIDSLLKKIKTAIYGKDVRSAIHDSIHKCYEDGKAGATDLVARDRIESAQAQISQFTKLTSGSTTGDAELMNIRIGADGTTYDTAGDAVREQIRDLHCIEVTSEETHGANYEPTRDNTHLWLNLDETDMWCMPEIADNEISSVDTWSSSKIHKKLSTITDYIESGIDGYMVDALYEGDSIVTYYDIDDCESVLATPSQAYTNGFISDDDVLITGIKLKSGTTATKFSMFVFDETDTLIKSYENLSPSISDDIATLSTPIEVKAGNYILIRFLNGQGYYKVMEYPDYREYRPGTGELINSTIKLGVEFQYITKSFKMGGSSIRLSDYKLPKCKVTDGKYTLIGRWFNKRISNVNRDCTNADGSSIIFKVNGTTSINVGLYPITNPVNTPYFAYSIDGAAFTRQKITNTKITLPDDGEHIVWVVIDGMGENDPYSGGKWLGTVGVYFTGITGGTTNALSYSNRQIMFIGDSIVEGINTLGVGSTADTNSAVNGFAFKTARNLNAIPLMCGYGGTAVLGDASFHRPIEAIDYNMYNVLVNEQDPDIIVIEHGYNDGALVGSNGVSEADFETAYSRLIQRITVKYPGVPIMCMIPFKQTLAASIRACAANYSHCYVIETSTWDLTYTDNSHLDVNGAATAASNLSQSIATIMGNMYFY